MEPEKKKRLINVGLGLFLILVGVVLVILMLIRGPQLWHIGGFLAIIWGIFLVLPGDKKTFLSS